MDPEDLILKEKEERLHPVKVEEFQWQVKSAFEKFRSTFRLKMKYKKN